jgi:hypothetical protein
VRRRAFGELSRAETRAQQATRAQPAWELFDLELLDLLAESIVDRKGRRVVFT